MRVAQGPQRLEEAFLRQHEAHVSGNGLHDDRRDVLAVQVENVLDGPHVIVGGKQGVADRAFRHAGVPGWKGSPRRNPRWQGRDRHGHDNSR